MYVCSHASSPKTVFDLICMQEIFSNLQAEGVQLCVCCLGVMSHPVPLSLCTPRIELLLIDEA